MGATMARLRPVMPWNPLRCSDSFFFFSSLGLMLFGGRDLLRGRFPPCSLLVCFICSLIFQTSVFSGSNPTGPNFSRHELAFLGWKSWNWLRVEHRAIENRHVSSRSQLCKASSSFLIGLMQRNSQWCAIFLSSVISLSILDHFPALIAYI